MYHQGNLGALSSWCRRKHLHLKPFFFFCYHSWCKPCHALAPRLQEVIAERPGRVQLAKIDVDEHTDLAMEYDVSSIPKVIMFKEGKVAGEFIGLMEKDKIESFVDRLTL